MKNINHLGQKIILRESIQTDIPALRKLINAAYVGQFAVAPDYKKHGYGSLLMDYCETLAQTEKFDGLQLDTAKPATHLVNWYLKRGYVIVGETHWEGKTYDSFIFEKIFFD